MLRFCTTIAAAFALEILSCVAADGFDVDRSLSPRTKILSFESAFSHFGGRLNTDSVGLQAWNVAARISFLPFGTLHFRKFSGFLDGAPEIGVQTTFERFNSQRQNFAGLGITARYYLTSLHWGAALPWIDASITAGGTDLNIGRVSNETRLTGPFMNLIQAGAGVSYFVSEHCALYGGFRAQHVSNAGLNGSNRNFSLNSAEGLVLGISWYFP